LTSPKVSLEFVFQQLGGVGGVGGVGKFMKMAMMASNLRK
jgi:hypothetical protein